METGSTLKPDASAKPGISSVAPVGTTSVRLPPTKKLASSLSKAPTRAKALPEYEPTELPSPEFAKIVEGGTEPENGFGAKSFRTYRSRGGRSIAALHRTGCSKCYFFAVQHRNEGWVVSVPP